MFLVISMNGIWTNCVSIGVLEQQNLEIPERELLDEVFELMQD